MKINGWKYYNHAAIPTVAPHEKPDLAPIRDGNIWRIDRRHPLLARWTTDFDCGIETNWWYVVKDDPFDISRLKAKRRYEINKGNKYFSVMEINPTKYKDTLFQIQYAAYSAYPLKYRPTIDKNSFFEMINSWENCVVIGAFFRETNELVGYAMLNESVGKCIHFNILKSIPNYEKYSINAALVMGIMSKYDENLKQDWYICDGSRNINHETRFQDYLEKYFGFRKAYCQLHIAYRPGVKWLIRVIFPIRKLLLKFDRIRIVHAINSILRMEEMNRSRGTT